jgi:hypothetical protein
MAQFRVDQHQYLPQEKTLFEVVKISDRFTPSGTATDAFGRLRVSNPFTLFDSQNRYAINEKFNSSNTGTSNANVSYTAHQSAIDLNVGTTATDVVKRETKRVFAYQPGKSLLTLNTFAMADAQANLTQRVGYFNDDNGVYLEKSNTDVYLVLRSNSSGTISETRVLQSNWSEDKFDGTAANSYSTSFNHGALDTSNTNIFWADIEWLGVGDVRCGFVVDGAMLPAHIFHNDNIKTYPYMTTACLPIRYEIFNTGITANNSTLKQICSTVISEGGYQLQGRSRTIGHNVNSAVTLTTAGVDYTVLSIRLRSERPDAIVLPKTVNILGISNNPTRLKYKIVVDANTSGGTWTNLDTANSAVQYNLGTSIDGASGFALTSGFIPVTNQSAGVVNLSDDIFRYQLERNNFANTNSTFSIVVSGATNGDQLVASLDWDEVV